MPSDVGDREVEPRGQNDRFAVLIGMQGFVLHGQMVPQLLDGRRLCHFSGKRGHLWLYKRASFEYLSCFLFCRLGDKSTTVRLQTNKPIMRKGLQCLTNQGPAYGVNRRELVLGKLRPRGNTMADDRFA